MSSGGVHQGLTEKQRAVLQLVRQGLSNKEVAEQMRVSINTIKFHLKEMARTLGARNRCAIIHIAQMRGLL
jgi:DNA-binding NarL/FixJ family response regulator